MDKVFTEVASLFPNPYIHVGGDECYKGYWAQDAGCQALMKKIKTHHVEDLQGYFMGRLEKILAAKGKKLLGWDEISRARMTFCKFPPESLRAIVRTLGAKISYSSFSLLA